MIALPILGKLTWIFYSCSRAEIQVEYPFCAYLFLCSIFVAITNQVNFWIQVEFMINIFLNLQRFISGRTLTLICPCGFKFCKTIT